MFKIFLYILSPAILIIVAYELITNNFNPQPILMLLLSLLMLVMGIEQFRTDKRPLGWLFIAVFLFTLFVSIKGFLIN